MSPLTKTGKNAGRVRHPVATKARLTTLYEVWCLVLARGDNGTTSNDVYNAFSARMQQNGRPIMRQKQAASRMLGLLITRGYTSTTHRTARPKRGGWELVHRPKAGVTGPQPYHGGVNSAANLTSPRAVSAGVSIPTSSAKQTRKPKLIVNGASTSTAPGAHLNPLSVWLGIGITANSTIATKKGKHHANKT